MTAEQPDRQMRTLRQILDDNGLGLPPAAQWPNPQLPISRERLAAAIEAAQQWPLPPDPGVGIEVEQREARANALHEAVMLHGEAESQECFRADEVDRVIETAKRFYEYIWEAK